MPFQALFQSLPMLVVEKIVEYLEGRLIDFVVKCVSKHNETKKILYPLLSVSEIWCEAALASICDNCEIVFDNTRGFFQVKYPAWSAGVSYSQFPRNNMVKRVVVTAPNWKDMCDKNSAETIAWSQYSGAIFPSATTLLVKLNKSKAVYSKPGSAISPPTLTPNPVNWRAGAVDFACALLQLTPAITGVSVVTISVDATDKSHRDLRDMLVSELCRGSVTRLDVKNYIGHPLLSLLLHDVSRLMSITQGSGIACLLIARLAYLNARTLKELHIKPATLDDWSSLIGGGIESPASYTSLVSLSMVFPTGHNLWCWTTVEGIAPFPALSKLTISGGYPFDDNTLFRGNRGMLQKFSISFYTIARNALGRSGVFERSGITRVSSIHIVLTSDTYEPTPSDDLVRKQMHRILEISTIMKLGCNPIYGQMLNKRVLNALCAAPSTAILQHLTLFHQRCDIGNVISIIDALPSLVSLTSQICGSAKRIGLIPENEHPSALHERYFPLSNNFRVLRVSSVVNIDIGIVSIVAMQIAVICPNFAYVDLPLEVRKAFRGKATWSSKNGPFKTYGDALRRLI
ncbi:hypothetical protein GGI17_006020 [Coemansia sp. S146]|nr:hypothetical protein GGI17_006020 [Coemansia sp. S146]